MEVGTEIKTTIEVIVTINKAFIMETVREIMR